MRKSRSDSEGPLASEVEVLARHERALLDLAKRLNLNVTEIYREVVSGDTIASRPVMQRLLSEVEQGAWEGVLVMEVERLARGDTIDQGIVAQTFQFSDTKIITPLKTYDPNNEFDEEYFEFGLFMSRREYKVINRRLQRGRIASFKEGHYVGNKTPYGYRKVKIEGGKGFTLEILEPEADIVRLAFNLYTEGELLPDGSRRRLGPSLICRRLNEMKFPTKSGNTWSPHTIRGMLTNPVYIGKMRWNYKKSVKRMEDGKLVVSRPKADPSEWLIVDGFHPPIIDKQVFDMAQELMANRPPRPVKGDTTIKNPLAGLVVCGKCGRKMARRPYGPRPRADTLMCPDPMCSNVSSDLALVESRIIGGLEDWLSSYRLKWEADSSSANTQIEIKRKSVERLEKDLVALDRQLSSVHDLLEQGVYDTETFLQRSRTIAERIQSAKGSIETLNGEIALESKREEAKKDVIPAVEHLLEVYYTLETPKLKNDMLRAVLEKVVYTKERSARWRGVSPDDFELVLYPRLPDGSG